MKTITILLIEDNTQDIRLIKEMLKEIKSFNYNLLSAETLKDGCEQIQKNNFDIILLDLNLPDSMGQQTFEKVIDCCKEIPVVLITGNEDQELSVKLIMEGAQDYITKQSLNPAPLEKSILYSIERQALLRNIKTQKAEITRIEKERMLLAKFPSQNPDPILRVAINGKLLYINEAGIKLLPDWQLVINESIPSKLKDIMDPVFIEGTNIEFELGHREFIFSFYAVPLFEEGYINLYGRDITKRKKAENRQALTASILLILNRQNEWQQLIKDILTKIKEFTGFEAIGIRLKEGEDYPYFETSGFPSLFVEKEKFLCARDLNGKIIYDSNGKPYLECMCGNIISHRTDQKFDFFTEYGSFWSNNTTELLASTTEEDLQTSTRNHCNGEGYESVALIPLQSGAEIIGLLQLNDKRTNRFTLEVIQFFEEIGSTIGIAFKKMQDEKQISDSENKFRSYIENAPDSIFVVDNKGKYIEVNNSVSRMTGYSLKELENKYIHDLLAEESLEAGVAHFKTLLEKGKACSDLWHKNKDGSKHLFVVDAVKLSETRALGFAKDITERRLTEENLKISLTKYKVLFDSFPLGITVSDKVGNIVESNQRAEMLLGLSHEEQVKRQILGSKWNIIRIDGSLFPQEEYASVIALKENRLVENIEMGIVKGENEITWLNVTAAPIPIENFGVSIVYNDITDRKQAEQQLIIAKERAEQSDRLKTAFLCNMSHEIRTPMNGILGFAELLKEPDLTGEQQQEYLKIIEKSGTRMLNIINDIVDISKIEAGLMKVSISETNINEQIEYIYTFFNPEVERKGMQLFIKNSLPSKEAIFKTDREKVYAILTNLVKNAIKYSNKGSITIGCDKKDEYLEIYVKDTGIGIPKDRKEAIFERFIQADIIDKMARQGAGLGLSISKAYIEMLGGKIWVESEEGKGSTFYFTLTYNTEHEEKIVVKNIVKADVEENQMKKLKILIAEDDESSDKLISIVARKFGKEIINVVTGTKAVEVCRNNSDIDLVLMDIQMPEMNGYEATRQIRLFNKDVVIIAQTAFALTGDSEKAIEAGCNDYISKPINRDKLMKLMQKYFVNK